MTAPPGRQIKMNKLSSDLNFAPERINNIYLMGIGGVAMGALAAALKRQGLNVRGSDNPLYPPMSTFLEQNRIQVAQGYSPDNLRRGPRPDLVIVGNVIQAKFSEVAALAELELPYLSLPQAVAHFFIRDRTSIVVAGTHGKTTTTALIASSLMRAGLDPGFMVGGIMLEGGKNFEAGGGDCFVVEGDEYDCAFYDKRPKFVHYRPKIALLTSLEFDHADIYRDMDAVRRAFGMLIDLMPPDGVLVAWRGSGEVMAQAARAGCKVVTYGAEPGADWRLLDLKPARQGGMDLKLGLPDGRSLEFYTPLVGEHNALNILGAAAAMAAAGVSPEKAAELQAGYGGVKRRQEIRGRADGVLLVDDFAHHPTAVRETVKAVARFGIKGWNPGGGRLVAVFEPRTNTSKRNFFKDEYPGSFEGADLVMLREPPGVEGLDPEERFSCAALAAKLNERKIAAKAFEETDQLLDGLLAELEPGDLCLIMSNGGFDNLHQRLLTALGQRESAQAQSGSMRAKGAPGRLNEQKA